MILCRKFRLEATIYQRKCTRIFRFFYVAEREKVIGFIHTNTHTYVLSNDVYLAQKNVDSLARTKFNSITVFVLNFVTKNSFYPKFCRNSHKAHYKERNSLQAVLIRIL